MYILIAIVLAVIFLIALLTAIFGPSDRYGSSPRAGAGVAAGAVFVVFMIVTALFSATTVAPRSVGIQTSFGRYVDTLPNGFHWTAPWSSVEEFSTQIQDLNITVPVSFDGGSSGEADVTLLWAIDGEDAEQLWKDHKTFDNVRNRVVEPAGRTHTAAAFSGYQPQDARNGGNRVTIQESIYEALAGETGDGGAFEGRGIVLDSVQLTDVRLGARAQESVDRIAEADANTERAESEQERARIEAETAKIRQESQTEEALQRYCLEVVNAWDVAKNGPLPATFNCVLSGGSQTPVIVGQN